MSVTLLLNAPTRNDLLNIPGTGNVLKVQNLLHICSEHYETDKDKEGEKKADDKKTDTAAATAAKDETKKDETKTEDKKTEEEKAAEAEGKDGSHQGIAVLGIALIAMGEDIGTDMALRAFNHLVYNSYIS